MTRPPQKTFLFAGIVPKGVPVLMEKRNSNLLSFICHWALQLKSYIIFSITHIYLYLGYYNIVTTFTTTITQKRRIGTHQRGQTYVCPVSDLASTQSKNQKGTERFRLERIIWSRPPAQNRANFEVTFACSQSCPVKNPSLSSRAATVLTLQVYEEL